MTYDATWDGVKSSDIHGRPVTDHPGCGPAGKEGREGLSMTTMPRPRIKTARLWLK